MYWELFFVVNYKEMWLLSLVFPLMKAQREILASEETCCLPLFSGFSCSVFYKDRCRLIGLKNLKEQFSEQPRTIRDFESTPYQCVLSPVNLSLPPYPRATEGLAQDIIVTPTSLLHGVSDRQRFAKNFLQ